MKRQFLCGLWLFYDVVLFYLRNKNHNWARNTKIKRNDEKSHISPPTPPFLCHKPDVAVKKEEIILDIF